MTNEQALALVLDDILDQLSHVKTLEFDGEVSNAVWMLTLLRARNLVRKCKEKAA